MPVATKRDLCVLSTNTVCKCVNDAIDLLQQRSAIVNGYGILFDVGETQFALAQARQLIEQAQKAATETSWPTEADYKGW